MISSLQSEQRFLEHIQTTPEIGICFRDSENKLLIQIFIDDPALREAILEYQSQRVRELECSAGQAVGR
ncbi:hypothetical protein G8759_19855 [Spirosoma aureum]|uniref:Uncharacterized protein n=1 Tax=Spirosoma aureum TaxID=2692134 RepID=A0A6G9AQU1_9BACT|nr:hypothetical protein [Spirosoma aureum]QIP14706.1 hypothetical protein G8759_19855 [Spirosoma aureum]